MLYSSAFFQINYIITISVEALAAIGFDTFFAIALKGRSESLGLFSCALFRPCGRDFKGRRPRLELLSVSTTTAMNTDGVGNQFSGLVAALLDVSHLCQPLF